MHPGDRHYRNQMVRLADLTVTHDVIEGVTFENCTLVGPAIILLMGNTSATGCSFEGDAVGLFWPLGDRDHVIGAIAFVGCTIVGCRLQRIGLAYPPEQEQTVRGNIKFSE